MGQQQLLAPRAMKRSHVGTDPHMRSLRPRSGTHYIRSVPPQKVGVLPTGFAALVATLVAAAAITGAVVFLVWVKMVQVQIGYDLHSLQQELAELRRERAALEVEVSSLRRPDRLAKIGAEQFDLHPPSAGQVLRLSELKKQTTP